MYHNWHAETYRPKLCHRARLTTSELAKTTSQWYIETFLKNALNHHQKPTRFYGRVVHLPMLIPPGLATRRRQWPTTKLLHNDARAKAMASQHRHFYADTHHPVLN